MPRKNLAEIAGLTLVAFKAIAATRARTCSHLAISTDSTEIAAEAAKYGVEAPFMRPAELAGDTARSDDVVLHAMDYFERERRCRFDAVMLLEPASPFATADDLDAASVLFSERSANLVVGMRRTEVHSIFCGTLGADFRADHIVRKFSDRSDLRGQALQPEYTMNGALYLIGWDHMRRTGKIYGDPENTFGYVMDRHHSIEIETPEDLELARFLASTGRIDLSPWC